MISFEIFNLIPSAKTLFPSKFPFTGSEWVYLFLGGIIQSTTTGNWPDLKTSQEDTMGVVRGAGGEERD